MKFQNEMVSALDERMAIAGITLEGTEAHDALRAAFYEFNADGSLKNPDAQRDYLQQAAIKVIQDKVDDGTINKSIA